MDDLMGDEGSTFPGFGLVFAFSKGDILTGRESVGLDAQGRTGRGRAGVQANAPELDTELALKSLPQCIWQSLSRPAQCPPEGGRRRHLAALGALAALGKAPAQNRVAAAARGAGGATGAASRANGQDWLSLAGQEGRYPLSLPFLAVVDRANLDRFFAT